MMFHNRREFDPDRPLPFDVIVSGAGPVGLFLASELALANCSVLVLEKEASSFSPLKRMPFGIRGLNSLSVEALYRRGLLSELQIYKRLPNPHQVSNATNARQSSGHFAGIALFKDLIDSSRWKYRLPSSTDAILISEMEELETVLTRRAEALGVKIRRGLAVSDFQQMEDGVTVMAGDRSFHSKWLVGCDGSRSVVRRVGGFEFAGTEPEFTGYSALVDLADPEKLKPGRNLTAAGMYLQSQPGYIIVQDFDGGVFHDSRTAVTREHLQEVLRRVSETDVTIRALHLATTWADRTRQAAAYRNGRVLLAGDAAHIHSPLGGQGLNLGLGDAMNLGWKLAATIHGVAPEGLLDSYFSERSPVGSKVLDWSRAQVEIMKPEPGSRALNAIVRDLMDTRDGATYVAGRIWGIDTHYDLGGDHPLTGRSAPNFEFEDGTCLGDLMHKGKGLLLDFEASAPRKMLAGEYAGRLNYVARQAKESLGLSAVLIRPDGFIAWASESEADDSSMGEALSRWFIFAEEKRLG